MILATCLGLVAIGCASTADETAVGTAAPEPTSTAPAEPSPAATAVPTATPVPTPTAGPAPLPTRVAAVALDVPTYAPTGDRTRFTQLNPWCGVVSGSVAPTIANLAADAHLVVAASVDSILEGRTLVQTGAGADSRFQAVQLDDVVALRGDLPDGPLLVEVSVCGLVTRDENGGGRNGVLPADDAASQTPGEGIAVWFLYDFGTVESSAYDIVVHPDAAWSPGMPLYRTPIGGIVWFNGSGVRRTDYDIRAPIDIDSDDALVDWVVAELDKPIVEDGCITPLARYFDEMAYDDATVAEIRTLLDQECLTSREFEDAKAQYPNLKAVVDYGCPELAVSTDADQPAAETSTAALRTFGDRWREVFGGEWFTGDDRLILDRSDDPWTRVVEAWTVETPDGWVIDRYEHCVGVSP